MALSRPVEIAVLSKFPEIFEGFRESIDRDCPEVRKEVVFDGAGQPDPKGDLWGFTHVNLPFQMAFNGNLALRGKTDVVYCGDDTRIMHERTVELLQEAAYSQPDIGILSPRIMGHAQAEQMVPKDWPLTLCDFVAFVFVYIKREVIEKIGYLDQRFVGYGMEDIDFCYRARLAGFKIAVASEITVKHGVDGKAYGSTFIRTTGEGRMAEENRENMRRFAEKWGIENDARTIFRAIHDLSATVSR